MNFKIKIFYLIAFLIITGCSLKKKEASSTPKVTQPQENPPITAVDKTDKSQVSSTPPKPVTPIVTDAGTAGTGTAEAGTSVAEAGVANAGTDTGAEVGIDTGAEASVVKAGIDTGAAEADTTLSVNITKETTAPSPCPTDDNVTTQTTLDVCHFPNSLKKAIETQLKVNCADVTAEHLSQIKQLVIRDINEDELNELHNNKYACFFTSLEKLDIAENPQLLYLPSFVTDLSTLTELNISKTGISDFSSDICNLKNLVSLKASHNNYKDQEVPINTFCLSKLNILDMSYSSIRYIDEYIYKLTQLEELHMRNNQLMVVPFMLHIMPSLLLIDLTENIFTPPSWLESFVGYNPFNALHSCKSIQDIDDRKECQEGMLDNFRCGWWYKLPFKRGYPFRRYKEMTDEEFEAFTAEGQFPSKNKCYLYWLGNKYIPSSEGEKATYLEHTINGKTIREWRVVFPALVEHWGDWYGFKNSFTYCGQKMLYADTSYGPDSHEIFPEQYEGEWDKLPTECKEDSYLYE